MKKPLPTDIGASVRARLLHIARERGEDFQFVLMRYANLADEGRFTQR